MSNKQYCFDNKEAMNKSTNSKIIMRPISNIVTNNKLIKEIQMQIPNNKYNGSSNKIIQKPIIQNKLKSFELKKTLNNSKSNEHVNKYIEEDLMKAYYVFENSNKSYIKETGIGKNSIFGEKEDVKSYLIKDKENIKLHDSYNRNLQKNSQEKNSFGNYFNMNFDDEHLIKNSDNNFHFTYKSNVSKADNDTQKYIKRPQQANNTNRSLFENNNYNKNNSNNTVSNALNDNFNKNSKFQAINNNIFPKNNKPTMNNHSLNLPNKMNFLHPLSNKNSFNNNFNNNPTFNLCKNNKNSSKNSNFIGVKNYNNFNNNIGNPTVLKSSFIMSGFEKKKSVESKNYCEKELQDLINVKGDLLNKENIYFNILKNSRNMTYDESANEFLSISKEKNSNIKKKNSFKINKSNGETDSTAKQHINIQNFRKFSENILAESQNKKVQDIQSIKQNKSISFNNTNIRSNSNNMINRRPKSQNVNEIKNNIGISELESNFASLDSIKKKYFNLLNNSKNLSILDLKKKYNALVKKKKNPTSLLISSKI